MYDEYANTLNSLKIAATVVSLDKISQIYRGVNLKRSAADRIKLYNKQIDKNMGIDLQNLSVKAWVFIPFIQCEIYIPLIFCSKMRTLLKICFNKKIP